MNACKLPEICREVKYETVTEDTKTKVYLSVVREFNEAEYEQYYLRRKKAQMRKRIRCAAKILKYIIPVFVSVIMYQALSQKLYLVRGSYRIGSEVFFVGIAGVCLFWLLDWLEERLTGGDHN